MKAADGVPFRSACHTGVTWGDAAAACGAELGTGTGTVGLVYVTEDWAAHLGAVADRLRQDTGVALWTGCVGASVCGSGGAYRTGSAISAMILDVPEATCLPLPLLRATEDVAYAPPDAWIGEGRPLFALVHADPRAPALDAIIHMLPEALDGYLVGGLTATPGGPNLLGPDGPETGAVGGLVCRADVPVAVGLTQGCRPAGPVHIVTSVDEDWLVGLDGRPALDVLRDDLGVETNSDLRPFAGWVHTAFPIRNCDTRDYVVRNLETVDPHTGHLGIGAFVTEGDRMMFVHRDRAAAEGDLRRMVRRLLARTDRPPRGALYVSCRARGAAMFGIDPGELGILYQELGDIPLTGFFAGGEINNNRLYTYTGVLTLFL